MSALHNLVVELDAAFVACARAADDGSRETGISVDFVRGIPGDVAAWIDETFGGAWSSEAAAGDNVVARRNGRAIAFATVDARGLRFRWLRGLAVEDDVGLFGPFGVCRSERRRGIGRAVLLRGMLELAARGYARAVVAAVAGESLLDFYARVAGARVAERFSRAEVAPSRRTVVMASGNGSNLQAVIDARAAGRITNQLTGVVVNRASAFAIERANVAGIPVRVATWDRVRESRDAYDARLRETVEGFEPELVVLLGWMHLLDRRFVRSFPRIVNLHPAFLPIDFLDDDVAMPDGSRVPAFRGAHAVRDAVAAGVCWTGATVHDVTADTDRGPVVVRKPVRRAPTDDEAATLARIRPVEHELVVAAMLRCAYES